MAVPKDEPLELLSAWKLVLPKRRILAAGLFLLLLNRMCGLVLPYSTRILIDQVLLKHHFDVLRTLLAVVVGATLLQGATTAALTAVISKTAQRKIAGLRCRLQDHMVRLPLSYYDSIKTGAAVSRVMAEVESARNLIGTGVIGLIGATLTAILALVYMISISLPMTAIALGTMALEGMLVVKEMRIVRPIVRERWKINAQVVGRLAESISGIRVVKAYHAEKRESALFRRGISRLLDNSISTLNATSLLQVCTSVVTGLTGAATMLAGARMIYTGHMTLGSYFTFTALLAMVTAPVQQALGIGAQFSEAFAGLERALELLRTPPEDADSGRTEKLGPLSGRVVFDHVGFSYVAGVPVLEDICFEARPNTVTALVGPSGAGKSTVMGLIAAFYRPESGRILVDGADLSTVRLDSFRTQLGMVLQESFLFAGTIRDNVAFAAPDATDAEITAACRIARVDEFAESFPDGYQTVVGERGVKLSGGQRQRISIARAVLANPRILILDEATSSLDSESEALIQEALSTLMQGRTTFVIAHRLSTVRKADQILVMEGGSILERGTHESLCRARGRYFELYSRQKGASDDIWLTSVGELVSS